MCAHLLVCRGVEMLAHLFLPLVFRHDIPNTTQKNSAFYGGDKGPTPLYTLLSLNLLLNFSQISLNLSGHKPPIQTGRWQPQACAKGAKLGDRFSRISTFSILTSKF